MRYTIVFISAFAFIMLSSFTPGNKLVVTSKMKKDGSIPRRFTCEGRNVSPPLKVENIPAGTQSLAVTLHDPDAALDGGFTHWVVWDIPVRGSDKKICKKYKRGSVGVNTMGKHDYRGMCPPVGTHHYHFKVYALDTKLNIDLNSDKSRLEEKMRGHILAEGELVGLYAKKKMDASGGSARPSDKK